MGIEQPFEIEHFGKKVTVDYRDFFVDDCPVCDGDGHYKEFDCEACGGVGSHKYYRVIKRDREDV